MNLAYSEKFDSLNMKNYVYKVLKENIMQLKLKPGTNLRKEDIAKELKVSRTPIREAFVKLSEDGLIDVYPQRGTSVTFIDLRKVEEAKFMREHLEKAVVTLGCEVLSKDDLFELRANINKQEMGLKDLSYMKLFKLDTNFHKLIFQGCDKSTIWSSMQQVSTHLNRFRMLSLAADFNREEVIADHKKIYTALKERDKEKAEQIMKNHIERIQIDEKKLKSDYPNYFKQ